MTQLSPRHAGTPVHILALLASARDDAVPGSQEQCLAVLQSLSERGWAP